MNILLIGDSWGVPNYYGSPGVAHEYHTEYLLRNLGYTVYNCSLNGGSNLTGIVRAKEFLSGQLIAHPAARGANFSELLIDVINPKIDWVVWFHTELFRDFDILKIQVQNKTLEHLLSHYAHISYGRIANFFQELGSKIAVIEGQCIVRPELYDYIKPDFIVEDWRSKILGKEMPKVYTLRDPNWVENLDESTDTKINILNDHKTLISAMCDSIHFPDNCHPGIEPHRWLSETLDKVFKGEVAQTVRAMDS